MNQNFSIFFTFDFENNSLIICSDEDFAEERDYGLSTMEEKEFLDIVKNITLEYLKRYKEKYKELKD